MKTASRLMKSYDAYLFDWDGTLAQTHDIAMEMIRSQITRYGLQLSDREIVDKIFGRYDEGMLEAGVPEQDLPALGEEIIEGLKHRVPLAPLYPGALGVLRRLKMNGRKLALITASDRKIIDAAVVRHELAELFDVIVTGDEMRAQKPDPGGLLQALKALGTAPENAVMIGDSKKDILAGQNAGTDTLLFYPLEHETQHDLHELRGHQPTYIIHSWRELLDQLQ